MVLHTLDSHMVKGDMVLEDCNLENAVCLQLVEFYLKRPEHYRK